MNKLVIIGWIIVGAMVAAFGYGIARLLIYLASLAGY